MYLLNIEWHTKCRYRWHEKSVTGCLVKKYMVYPLMQREKSAELDIVFGYFEYLDTLPFKRCGTNRGGDASVSFTYNPCRLYASVF